MNELSLRRAHPLRRRANSCTSAERGTVTISSDPEVTTKKRSLLRSVAVPKEHGGWGLTLEPGLLGYLLAPGVAGLCVAMVALVGFLARTPLRLVLIDLHRGRSLERTRVACWVAASELVVFAALIVGAVASAQGTFWLPTIVAVPFFLVAFRFEMRSRGRRLVPELAGAVGICSVAATVVLVDGGAARLAAGTWLVLAARAVTSIPHVREMITRLHARPQLTRLGMFADGVALLAALGAAMLDPALIAGAVAMVLVVLIQRRWLRGAVVRAVVTGTRQMALGMFVVAACTFGVLVFH